MAGVSSATLEGWAIPMVGAPTDHTYATSSCGLRWSCWGRSVGGTRLRFAVGSSAIADCLSQPNSEARIRYGLTGVCHQTANRILHPAGITVAGCRGYNYSVHAFGKYGRGQWPELSACYSNATVSVSASVGSGSVTPRSGNLSKGISVDDTPQSSMEMDRLTEISALAEMALGHPLDASTRRSLQKIQRDFTRRQGRLVHNLDLGIVTSEEYLGQLNALLRSMMDRTQALLGDERFNAIFGEAGRYAEGLVDRGTFMEAVASERRSER
jgi:hypothetical protein